MAVDQPCDDRHGARIYWSQKDPDDGDEHGIGYDAGNRPDEDLEERRAKNKAVD